MDDLNDALDNLAKNSRNAAGTRVSRDVSASHGGFAAGRDIYLGAPPSAEHAIKSWANRWVLAPAAAGAGVTMAIFLVWTFLDARAALEAGYTMAQVMLQPTVTTPGRESFGTSLAVGGPVGVMAGWAWAFFKH